MPMQREGRHNVLARIWDYPKAANRRVKKKNQNLSVGNGRQSENFLNPDYE